MNYTNEKIERYLQGIMEPDELLDFEHLLQNNAWLRDKLEIAKTAPPQPPTVEAPAAETNLENVANETQTEGAEEPEANVENTAETSPTEEATYKAPEKDHYPHLTPSQKKTGVLANETAPSSNSYTWWGIAFLITSLVAAFLYRQFSLPVPVFESNMEYPEGLLSDYAARKGNGSVESMQTQNELCQDLFKDADEKYRAGKYEDAQEPLVYMAQDENSNCQSDAYFYIALIRLKLDDPETAVQCLSKIEDFDRYGEDIQWYMALSLVKMSEKDPSMQKKAKNSLDRILKSGQTPERKERALKMLEKLEN